MGRRRDEAVERETERERGSPSERRLAQESLEDYQADEFVAEPFAMSQPAISKHLKVLERAGLISRSRDAQRRPRKLEPKPLAEDEPPRI